MDTYVMTKISCISVLMVCILCLFTGAAFASPLKDIPWKDIEGVQIGNAQDDIAKTGVTVLYFPEAAIAGVDISGGGPASRETPVLAPLTNPTPVNAIVLAGGSAYGLAAADGVMSTLEKHGIGYKTYYRLVPIVCQSDIYDLGYGTDTAPGSEMGSIAAEAAINGNNPVSGNVGAGTGATVGKMMGMKHAMKSGIGYSAVQIGDLKLGAVVVVNALGDVYDHKTAQKIAGLLDENRENFVSGVDKLYEFHVPKKLGNIRSSLRANTTIGAIVCNGKFDQVELTKIAEMARNGYARCINPVGTMYDGDTIYAVSAGNLVQADINMVGTLAGEVMSRAIEDAIYSSQISNAEYLNNCK